MWYEELFANYAKQYDNEPYVKGTEGEADFIENEAAFDKGIKILDIGCGTGRHSIELAKRGYTVTGVDLSESQLSGARVKAEAAGEASERLKFLQADARKLEFDAEFDLVIMICEGAFPLMETDEMNFQILENAGRALKSGGTLIFTTLNGLYPLFHSVKDFINSHYDNNISSSNTFDLMTFRDYSQYEFTDDDGIKKTLECNERYYVPCEITWLLKSLGFTEIEILGCESGNWSRGKKLTSEDFEMLVIAKKLRSRI